MQVEFLVSVRNTFDVGSNNMSYMSFSLIGQVSFLQSLMGEVRFLLLQVQNRQILSFFVVDGASSLDSTPTWMHFETYDVLRL